MSGAHNQDHGHHHGHHGHDHHGHDHDALGPEEHGSMRSYMTGFVLAVILTAIPFWLVMGEVIADPRVTAFVIMGFAAVQIVVHMIYFLHMNPRSDDGWTLMALMFTVMIVVIALAGSLWVMYHLNTNMMPGPHDMRAMP